MGLYERLIGEDESFGPKIPIQPFAAVFAEYARSRLTGAEAQQIIAHVSGAPLSQSEVTEVEALLATLTGNGTTKLARIQLIDDCLNLAETGAPGYATPAALKAKLGV